MQKSSTQAYSVKTQLLVVFSIVIAFILIIYGISINKFFEIGDVIAQTRQVLNVEVRRFDAIDQSLKNCDDVVFDLQRDPSLYKGEGAEKLNSAVSALEMAMKGLGDIKSASDKVAVIKSGVDKYNSQLKDFIAYVETGDQAKTTEYYSNTLSATYDDIKRNLSNVSHQLTNNASSTINSLNANYDIVLLTIFTLIAVVISVILSFYYAGRLKKIVSLITDSIQRFGSGDLSVPVKVTSKTEFGQLQRSIERMRVDLVEIFSQVLDTSNKIESSIETIHEMATRVNDRSKDSESRTLTIATASDEMVSTTNDIAKNCATAADDASESSKTTLEVINSIEDAIKTIQKQADKSKEDADAVARLADQASNVSSIVEAIEDIANQTNLLALNAAIEAARAGEAGKGFAVVADEVRTLASRTSKSTQEITKMVAAMQQDAKEANDSMAASLENMDEIAKKSSALQGTLKNVITQVDSVNSQITQVVTAAEEQTTATSEVSNNMQTIKSSIKDLTESAQMCDNEVDNSKVILKELFDRLGILKLQ